MRFMLIVEMPVEPFNAAVRNGSAGPTMQKILEDAKPEAVYFVEMDGRRTGFLVVDLKSASEIPKYAEPWFLKFNAQVKIRPAMTPEDLVQANMAELGKKWA